MTSYFIFYTLNIWRTLYTKTPIESYMNSLCFICHSKTEFKTEIKHFIYSFFWNCFKNGEQQLFQLKNMNSEKMWTKAGKIYLHFSSNYKFLAQCRSTI